MKANKNNLKKIVNNLKTNNPGIEFKVRYAIVGKNYYALPLDHAIAWNGDEVEVEKIKDLLFNKNKSIFSICAMREDGTALNDHEEWQQLSLKCENGYFTHLDKLDTKRTEV